MGNFIQLENVNFSYKIENSDSTVLSDLNLSISQGEFIALIGQNGSGKSTLGKLLNALLLPDSGNVIVAGLNTRNPENHPAIRVKVGMVFQRPQEQIVATTVFEDVAFGPCNLGLPPSRIHKRVEEALAVTGLINFGQRPTYLLSAGETQRVALAGVLAMRPKCVIFDETTAMLDPAGREMVMKQAKKLHHEGITVLFITHLMEEAVQADRVLVLHGGKLTMDGSPAIVFSAFRKLRNFGLDLPPAALAANALMKFFPKMRRTIFTESELMAGLATYAGRNSISCKIKKKRKSSSICIDVSDLSHTYLRDTPLAHQSLKQCSINVTTGSAHGVIGSTGSGKSTLIQHLNGLITPQFGSVRVLQFELDKTNVDIMAVRQKVGSAFQQPEDQIFEQYVGDEIAFAAKNFDVPGKISDLVRSAMEAVGLDYETFKDRQTSSLSGGEQRKVALASVLAAQPRIFLLDEPLAGLDPISRKEITRHLANLIKMGLTLVISTHQFEGLIELLDEITVLKDGSDVIHGCPGEVFSNAFLTINLRISVPLAARIARRLRELGWPLPDGIVTFKEMTTALSRVNSGKKNE